LHRNQFIADVISARADPDSIFVTDAGNSVLISDFVARAMRKIDPGELTATDRLRTGPDGNELGWTLIAFSRAKLELADWVNEKRERIYFTDLLRIALDRPVNWGSYEGLIEQLGIAVSLHEYKKDRLADALAEHDALLKKNPKTAGPRPTIDTVELHGIWSEAQSHVDDVVALLKKNQNPDGSFSRSWHRGRKKPADFEEMLLYTGHALDFLAVALKDDQLAAPWVTKTLSALSKSISRNRYQLRDKIWAAAHAAHALMEYRNRLLAAGKPPEAVWARDPNSKCCGPRE